MTRDAGAGDDAVLKLPAKSVGTVQLKNKAVTAPKVASDTLTGAQINESTLGELPSGGIAGLGFKSAGLTIPAGMVGTSTVSCDNGLTALAGGAEASHDARLVMIDSHPVAPAAWQASIGNPTDQSFDGRVWVVCGKGAPGSGTVGTAAASRARTAFEPFAR